MAGFLGGVVEREREIGGTRWGGGCRLAVRGWWVVRRRLGSGEEVVPGY